MRNATNSKEWYTWVPQSQSRDDDPSNHQSTQCDQMDPRAAKLVLVILEWTWRTIASLVTLIPSEDLTSL